jgi:hypothetical protein
MPQDITRIGGCLCGAVRYEVHGEPIKAGLCHCADCRKATGTAFLAYADWRPDRFSYTGEVAAYKGRSFCPRCGSRLFSLSDEQAEVYVGTLDVIPSGISPTSEAWVKRREHWLPLLPSVPQYEEDPPKAGISA